MPVTFNFKGCFTESEYNASKKDSTNQPQAGHTKGPTGPSAPSLCVSLVTSPLFPAIFLVTNYTSCGSASGWQCFSFNSPADPGLSKTPDPCPHLLAVLAQTSPACVPGAALTKRLAAVALSTSACALGQHGRVLELTAQAADVHAWLLSKTVQRKPPGGRKKSQSHL